MTATKPPGHDWSVRYQFDDEAVGSVLLVFGQMTAEDALKEARYSLDGINDMNAGCYEIISVERT